MSQMILLGFSA